MLRVKFSWNSTRPYTVREHLLSCAPVTSFSIRISCILCPTSIIICFSSEFASLFIFYILSDRRSGNQKQIVFHIQNKNRHTCIKKGAKRKPDPVWLLSPASLVLPSSDVPVSGELLFNFHTSDSESAICQTANQHTLSIFLQNHHTFTSVTLHSYTLKYNRRIISAHMIVHHQLLTLSAAYLNHIFIIHITVKLLSKYKNHLFVLEKEKGITFASLLAGSSAHTSRMPR